MAEKIIKLGLTFQCLSVMQVQQVLNRLIVFSHELLFEKLWCML